MACPKTTVAVLVLNQDYEPLSLARVPRALALVERGRAEVLEHGVLPIQTPTCALPRPAVIRLMAYVRRPRLHVRFGRQAVFRRDGFACQYCGASPRAADLTLDHVLPRHRGGRDTWENVVAACRRCNQRKGGRTPEEARLPLRRRPFEPKVATAFHAEIVDTWRPWLGLRDDLQT